jgi:leader peptidase (prepilin peptidase)/N-methyltransferase
MFFILGTAMGSFYMVVGDRLPRDKSIINPPSCCDSCNKKLTFIELIPIVSYLIQGGKCRNCKSKIPITVLLYEILSGLVFAFNYYKYGLSSEIIIPLIFSSLILIILVSDLKYMIINDEVIVTSIILIFLTKLVLFGLEIAIYALLEGFISLLIMWMIKLFGDFMFKKESMGGGDIKLLFVFGLTLGIEGAILSIFIGSFIGLPISIIVLNKLKNREIPFGPFLGIGALLVMYYDITIHTILKLIYVI